MLMRSELSSGFLLGFPPFLAVMSPFMLRSRDHQPRLHLRQRLLVVRRGPQVPVAVERHHDRAVPHDRLDALGREPLLDEIGELYPSEQRFDVPLQVLLILTHRAAFQTVALSLLDPHPAGHGDRDALRPSNMCAPLDLALDHGFATDSRALLRKGLDMPFLVLVGVADDPGLPRLAAAGRPFTFLNGCHLYLPVERDSRRCAMPDAYTIRARTAKIHDLGDAIVPTVIAIRRKHVFEQSAKPCFGFEHAAALMRPVRQRRQCCTVIARTA